MNVVAATPMKISTPPTIRYHHTVSSCISGWRATHSWRAAERFAQLAFGLLQRALARFGQVAACAVDIEVQHRHRGLIRRAFAPFAMRRRAFQRLRDFIGSPGFEDVLFDVHRVAGFHHVVRPVLRVLPRAARCRRSRAVRSLRLRVTLARRTAAAGARRRVRHGRFLRAGCPAAFAGGSHDVPYKWNPPARLASRSERTALRSVVSTQAGGLYSFTPPASGASDEPGATSPTPNSSSLPPPLPQ
ncbi:hypothetical protein BCAR13_420158 [Paraburkholderia caribensis]|nr:hypothetical protein BCAR13_420158 [Paraburkholderia caribensis]